MNMMLFVSIVFALQLICFIAGKRASGNLNNQEDYFLAGKGIKFFPLLMTFVATQIGGGTVLGAAEEAFRFGWAVMLYPLGASLGFALLAMGVGKRLARFQVSTVAQLFEVVYRSRRLKQAASILSILSLFMILAGQVIASKKFMMSLGMDQLPLFLLFWGIVILYTAMGGLKAVVSIDVIQAVFFIVVFAAGFCYVVYTTDVSALQADNSFDFSLPKLSGWLLMPLLFMVIEQDMAQRCFAANSPRTVTRAAAWAAVITLLVCVIPVYFGVIGKQLGIDPSAGSSVFMDVAQALTSPAFAAFIGCAVLMAVISTAISLINAVSSNMSQDFNLLGKGIGSSRCVTGVIGAAAVGASFFFGGIVDLLIQSYELSVYCLFIPVVFALYRPQGNARAALFAMVCGGIGFILTRIWETPVPKEVICIAISLAGFVIGNYIPVYIRSGLREELG